MLKIFGAKKIKLLFVFLFSLFFWTNIIGMGQVSAQAANNCDDITVVDPLRGCNDEPISLGGLVNRVLGYLPILIPLIAGVPAGYFIVKGLLADEKEASNWYKRAFRAILIIVLFYSLWMITYLLSTFLGVQINPFE